MVILCLLCGFSTASASCYWLIWINLSRIYLLLKKEKMFLCYMEIKSARIVKAVVRYWSYFISKISLIFFVLVVKENAKLCWTTVLKCCLHLWLFLVFCLCLRLFFCLKEYYLVHFFCFYCLLFFICLFPILCILNPCLSLSFLKGWCFCKTLYCL